MARTYKRDGNGRFAGGGGSSGGGGGKRPAAKSVSRGVNRLTRDNAGKITSVGGSGATARGGRLKTAAGNKRAMQTAKVSGGRPAGTMKGKVKRDAGAADKAGRIKTAAPKPAAGSLAANKIEMAKGRASVMQGRKDAQNKQLKEINAKIKEAGPNAGAYRLQKLQIQNRLQETRSNLGQAQAARRPDRAEANIPMRGARGKALDAEITRNVKAQKTAKRAADKTRNQQYKSDQSRAKKLREVHLGPLAAGYAQRSGRNVTEVKKRISGMAPSDQVKLFKQYVKENRSTAKSKSSTLGNKPVSKAGTSTSDIATRRARANAPKTSMYLSQKMNTTSAITRSAANAIYNEQRSTLRMQKSKQASPDVIKIGLIGRGLSGSKRDRAMANREAARKRFVGGRRR